jgi:LysM repeat protein
MIIRSHQKAFSLLLISKERLLTPSERNYLDEHLRTCNSCRVQSEIHQELRKSLQSTRQSPVLFQNQLYSILPGLLKAVERKRLVQKSTNLVLTSTKLGMVILLSGFFLWALNQSLPRSTPGEPQEEIFGSPAITENPSWVAPSATPITTPQSTETVSKHRTEVITYIVQPGDTILGIAEKFQLKPETILWGNYDTLTDKPSTLRVGMELNILPVDGVYYEWKEGDDLNAVAARFNVQADDIIYWAGNHLTPETLGDLSRPNIEPGTWLVIPGGRREFIP